MSICSIYLPNDSDKYVQQNKWNNDCSKHTNKRITDQRKLILTRQMLQVSEAKFLRDAGLRCNSSAKKTWLFRHQGFVKFLPWNKSRRVPELILSWWTSERCTHSRPISIVPTDWRVNKLMNTTSNLWFTIYYTHTVPSKIANWDQHIIGNCTMAQGNLH